MLRILFIVLRWADENFLPPKAHGKLWYRCACPKGETVLDWYHTGDVAPDGTVTYIVPEPVNETHAEMRAEIEKRLAAGERLDRFILWENTNQETYVQFYVGTNPAE